MNDIFNTEKHLNLSSRQDQTQLYSSSERKKKMLTSVCFTCNSIGHATGL